MIIIEKVLLILTILKKEKLIKNYKFDSLNYYKSIYNNSPIPYALNKIILDKDENPVDFVFIDVNKSFEN